MSMLPWPGVRTWTVVAAVLLAALPAPVSTAPAGAGVSRIPNATATTSRPKATLITTLLTLLSLATATATCRSSLMRLAFMMHSLRVWPIR